MKTIIAGSRAIRNYEAVEAAVAASKVRVTQVVSGTADGVDGPAYRPGKYLVAGDLDIPEDLEIKGAGIGKTM